MPATHLTLKVLLPFEVFVQQDAVSRLSVETSAGSYGFLPNRLDCVAALTPGILVYHSETEGEVFLAVDEGVLVKTGPAVLVSVRRALRGADLRQLRAAVEREFLTLDERERSVRELLAKLETGFLRRLRALQPP